MIPKKDIKIGLEFIPIGKKRKPYKLIDIYKTYNSKNEIVKTRYVCEYYFVGQKVTDYDICIVTIQRAEKIK